MQRRGLKMSCRACATPAQRWDMMRKEEENIGMVRNWGKYTKRGFLHVSFSYFLRLEPQVAPSSRSALSGPPCRWERVGGAQGCLLLGLCLWHAACVVRFVYSSWWPLFVSQHTHRARTSVACRTDSLNLQEKPPWADQQSFKCHSGLALDQKGPIGVIYAFIWLCSWSSVPAYSSTLTWLKYDFL